MGFGRRSGRRTEPGQQRRCYRKICSGQQSEAATAGAVWVNEEDKQLDNRWVSVEPGQQLATMVERWQQGIVDLASVLQRRGKERRKKKERREEEQRGFRLSVSGKGREKGKKRKKRQEREDILGFKFVCMLPPHLNRSCVFIIHQCRLRQSRLGEKAGIASVKLGSFHVQNSKGGEWNCLTCSTWECTNPCYIRSFVEELKSYK